MATLHFDSPGPPELWVGLECTVNRVGDHYMNQSELNGHTVRWSDIGLFASTGANKIRYPFLWETIAPNRPQEYDWSLADERMVLLREAGIEPIAGFVHHGSGPRWTNLLDPGFPCALAKFAEAFARRYPQVNDYTPVNEPLTTARFSALYGLWYPHLRDAPSFLKALVHELKATVLSMRAIRKINPLARLIQTEDLGRAQSTPLLEYQARHENHRRWLTYDFLCGMIDASHALYPYLTECAGVTDDELAWFRDNPCPPDVIGINHYLLSDRFLDERLERYPSGFHGGNGKHSYADVGAAHVADAQVIPLKEILLEAARRYGRAVAVTEVHVDGTRESQMRWLEETWNDACSLRAQGWPVEAVTVWSLLGSFDWNSLCTVPARYYEPGVFDVRGQEPRPTALYHMCRRLTADGRFEHPALAEPGWWHQSKRVLFPQRLVDAGRENHEISARLGTLLGARLSPRPILVIGARGTLGRAFARQLNARALPYRLCSRDDIDIADPASVAKCLDETRPWYVINAAGYVQVDRAEAEQDLCQRENADGPARLATACAERRIPLLTFSSDLVFDGCQGLPYLEHASVSPLSAYGRAKVEAERRVLIAHDEALIVRTSAFFGPWDESNFVTLALRTLSAKREFEAPMDYTVSPTYVPDLVNVALDHVLDGTRGILHLSNAGEITWSNLAMMAAERAGLEVSLVRPRPLQEFGWAAVRPKYSVLGSRYGRQLPSLERALDRYFDELSIDLREGARPALAEPS